MRSSATNTTADTAYLPYSQNTPARVIRHRTSEPTMYATTYAVSWIRRRAATTSPSTRHDTAWSAATIGSACITSASTT